MKGVVCFLLMTMVCSAQELTQLRGRVIDENGRAVAFLPVQIKETGRTVVTDAAGRFSFNDVPPGRYVLILQGIEILKSEKEIDVPSSFLIVRVRSAAGALEEVVVTGTMKEISKDESPINIDIVTPKLFQKTSTPNLFEATSLVNGVKPQINCNVCNTGDIHINGMEGPYTLILIDGMPIVSGLSSVYGLMGIPASMIERLEIAKGPAGALYGSEAMGGTINLITRNASRAPKYYVDYYATSYLENNLDLSMKLKPGQKINWLIGTNGYFYDNKVDLNKDGFTDVTLQKRFSLFNKLDIERPEGREFSIAGRYVTEDRWGGQMNWEKKFRGGDSIYGESIYMNRAELISKYEWPLKEKIYTQLSYNIHDQNSVYGTTSFIARQSTAFAQTYWTRKIRRNDLLVGLSYKNLWYDDNTVVTRDPSSVRNAPDKSNTVGLFVQDELVLDTAAKHKLLTGIRLDYNEVYDFIPSPRIAYKWSPDYRFIFRANAGTGFRIVNVFTEDHAALTGAREVVFTEKIDPEQSYNGSLNFLYKMQAGRSSMLIWDAGLFYYHFDNKIFADYDEDPQKVIYRNLDGHAYSRGGALNLSLASPFNFKFTLGATYAEVKNFRKDGNQVLRGSDQLNSPRWSGNLILSYQVPSQRMNIDITGNWYGPQRLAVVPNDFRPEYSPWFLLLNLQVSKVFSHGFEMYVGGKNLLNFLPKHPILRPEDPFDKNVTDAVNNPNGYTFDPSYNYAPMQGIRGYAGFRYSFK